MKYKPDNDMLTKLTRMGIPTPVDGFDLDSGRVAAFAAVLGDERRAAFRAIVELKDTGGLPDVPASQAMVPHATADQVIQVGPRGPAGTTDYTQLTNRPTLATVALTGAYADLTGEPANSAAQVNSDWAAGSGVAQILNKPTLGTLAAKSAVDYAADVINKPTIPAAQVQSDWSAVSGSAQILNKPAIPAAQVNSDWNAGSGVSQILNKPTLGSLAALNAVPVAQGNYAAAATPATTGTMTVSMGNATLFTITPTGACTFNASGGVAGQSVTFIVTTSGTTSLTLTFSTNFKAAGTLSTGTTSGKTFAISFICKDGTLWVETGRTAAM